MSQPLFRVFVPIVLIGGALAANVTAQSVDAQSADAAQFGAPEQLTADGKAMTGMHFPSPTLYDIDGDQQQELIIGDLRGFVQVAQPGGDKAGLNWSKLEHLQSNKKPLKLNNW